MQAARGASLSSDPGSGRARRPRPGPSNGSARHVLGFAVVGLVALGVDQVTKQLAVTRLDGEAPVRVVGDLLRLTLIYNPGAAFSTGTRFTPALAVLAIVAALVIGWYGVRARTPLWIGGLGLLIGGVTGNLADRLFRAPGPMRGHVVDFLQLPHWPIFNVADMCINVGVVLLLVQAYRGVRLDGRPVPPTTEAVEGPVDETGPGSR